jgi:phenylalanyl-tRNA synthetase alpha chain
MIDSGNLHPLTKFIRQSVDFFNSLGFEVYESPEVDSQWFNFDALNIPADHPSRDVQDTFFLTDERVLRTHTSNGQIRAAREKKLPLKIIIPGRCYRNEATDATHESTFYQIEGLYLDQDVKVGHLFWIIDRYLKNIFGSDLKIRFRPHHYPFVEPGMDVDIWYQDRWMEVLGSGMIHPKVISNMGLDSEKTSGFAFGLGIDRLVMRKYGIEDIRQFYGNDLRFLKQF